ncbi:hypothetical protein HRF87_10740 [Bacillus sp. CRN 9]|nr:hypothetical protein [Bacillus sp. CRN 9]
MDESSDRSGCFKRRKSGTSFLDKGKPYRTSFSNRHTLDGLNSLLYYLEEVTKAADGF